MASSTWAGFTDEDIERMKLNSSDDISDLASSKALKRTRKNISEELSEEVALRDSFTEKLQQFRDSLKEIDNPSLSNDCLENCTCNHVVESSEHQTPNGIATNRDEILDDQCLRLTSDCQDLEAFEIRKKLIEAENARRRALINKAITDKKERTQAEAKKLSHITDELNRLDSILSADIVILRDYIEKASKEFSQAEKRYLKAEKEFIEAKFFLFEKMQRKEQLTEHLCAIIEQNENRKANKLVELMKQLEMDTIVEDFQVPEMEPILSKYCAMNEEAYHCCQTFKPSAKNLVQEFKNNRTDDSKDEASDEGSHAEEAA